MSHSIKELIKYMDRGKRGRRVPEREWDNVIVPQTLNEVAKKYGLLKTCDLKNPVNMDLELADTFYKAGKEVALRLGLYNTDTETITTITEEELEASLKAAPSKLVLGKGLNEVVIEARKPEDGVSPAFGGPLSIQMNEEYYVPLISETLKSRLVDVHEGPSLDTIYGSPLLANTPYETAASFYEMEMRKKAQYLAGRQGMPNMLVSSSSTEYGNLATFAMWEQPQIALVLIPSSLKTNYCSLHKCVQTLAVGGYIESGSPNMIGGFTGGPETTALSNIADDLLQYSIHQAHMSGAPCYDIRYSGNCDRHALWSQSISTQAIARNTHLIMLKTINQVAGPCTEMFYKESIVGFAANSASGLTYTIGPRSAGGKYKNHLTPLDIWFAAACHKAGGKITLKKANEIANTLIPEYEKWHKEDPPAGRPINELYDMDTMIPIPEHKEMYLRMRKLSAELGMPLPSDGIYD
ncbi:monomethylamine:corrinoid methyltransferase [Clostridia bacterium]|nr:monomethylamine:corrinoid methyltransferase [Clostridia bacterium]